VFGLVPPQEVRHEVVAHQRLIAGGTIQATRLALRTGRPAINLGGGFHHAAPDRPMALCLFNDVAIAIERLRAKGFEGNVLVVDLDLHDGNGTRVAFSEDESVFTFSVHNQTWDDRPAVADRTLELGPDVGDALYLDTLRRELPPVFEEHRPALVVYVAGVDPGADDRIGNWNISGDGMLERDRIVFELLGKQRPEPALVVVLGGGYGERAWRHSARGFACLISRREYKPSRGMEPVIRLYRHLRTETRDDEGATDAGWTLSEEDLGAVGSGGAESTLVLEAMTPHAVELSLERFGLFEQIRALGFDDLSLHVEPTPPLGHLLRLVSDERESGPELLMEQRLSRNRSAIADTELLYAEWLLLQNPRKTFSERRHPLPGQDHPGLGLLRETVAWWIVLCEELRLDGVLFVPGHYYMAALGRRYLRFRSARDAAVFEALGRAVEGLELSEASRAIDAGRVVDERTGEPVRWHTPHMVLPVSESLRRRLTTRGYDRQIEEALQDLPLKLVAPGDPMV
jgi:acetoin utilization deacetylase AcuC-like enzyme